ncbi:hypothetical protein ACMFMF_004562 [Clarireedia jacksonii]
MTPDTTVQGSEERSMSNEGGEDRASAGSNTSANGEPQNKRRKTASTSGGAGGSGGTGSSSRGVANLTPEQLAKKRANDREAQRSIRQRTKNQIENYERKIRELTSQQPYQELQHVMRQKEMVEAENLDIKKRLSQVISLIQPILGSHGFEAPTQYSSPPTCPPPNRPGSANRNVSTPNSINSPGSIAGPSWPTSNTPALIAASPVTPFAQDTRIILHTQQAQQLQQQRHEMAHNLDMGPERLGLDFLLEDGQRVNKIPSPPGSGGPQESPNLQQIQNPLQHRSNSTTSTVTSFNTPNSTSSEINGHSAPIRNGPPTCPLDSLLLDFLHERQAAAANGVSTPKLVGPCYPSVSSLLNPSRSNSSHPVSKVFTDILGTFPDLSTLPEKVAVLYVMFLLMRWQIHPSRENYDRLPSWITPRPSQIFTPHPAWIDHLPFPKMRDVLVRDYNPRDYLFDNFFIPFTSTLSLNWPYEPTDTLLSAGAGGDDDELVINPVFERHMRRLENWSLGPAFASAFPGLKDTYRLKIDGDRK